MLTRYGRHVRHNVCGQQAGGKRSLWPVDEHVADVVKQFLGAVLTARKVEELRVLIDEVSVDVTREELLVFEDVHEERGVRLYRGDHITKR